MTKYGEKYEAAYAPDGGNAIRTTRRTIYRTSGGLTPEQSAAIDRVEKVLHTERINGDTYRAMKWAEHLGIELGEECLVDGKWHPFPWDEAVLTLMQKAAL